MKLHGCVEYFFKWFVDGFPFYCFSADSSGKKASFNAHCVGAVFDVACFFGPFAPCSVSLVDDGAFSAFE